MTSSVWLPHVVSATDGALFRCVPWAVNSVCNQDEASTMFPMTAFGRADVHKNILLWGILSFTMSRVAAIRLGLVFERFKTIRHIRNHIILVNNPARQRVWVLHQWRSPSTTYFHTVYPFPTPKKPQDVQAKWTHTLTLPTTSTS